MLIWPFSLPHSLSLCSLLLSLKDFTEVRQTRGRLSKRDREGKTERMNEWKMAIIVQTLARRERSSALCATVCSGPHPLLLLLPKWRRMIGQPRRGPTKRGERISLPPLFFPPPIIAITTAVQCSGQWHTCQCLLCSDIGLKWYRSRKRREGKRESSVQ